MVVACGLAVRHVKFNGTPVGRDCGERGDPYLTVGDVPIFAGVTYRS